MSIISYAESNGGIFVLIGHIIKTKDKTLYGALTRWYYTNTHITVYGTRYSTQLFQLRSKPGPELSGKVEYENGRLH